jgi:hypothetical protein
VQELCVKCFMPRPDLDCLIPAVICCMNTGERLTLLDGE